MTKNYCNFQGFRSIMREKAFVKFNVLYLGNKHKLLLPNCANICRTHQNNNKLHTLDSVRSQTQPTQTTPTPILNPDTQDTKSTNKYSDLQAKTTTNPPEKRSYGLGGNRSTTTESSLPRHPVEGRISASRSRTEKPTARPLC